MVLIPFAVNDGIRQLRQLEALRNLPEKEAVMAGLPHLDALRNKLLEADPVPPHETTVLLAPSWGANSIFSTYGAGLIDRLIDTGYHLIIRPHPQSLQSEKEMLDGLRNAYPDNDQLEWNTKALESADSQKEARVTSVTQAAVNRREKAARPVKVRKENQSSAGTRVSSASPAQPVSTACSGSAGASLPPA